VQGCDALATDYEHEALASVQCNADANGFGGSPRLRTRMVDWRDPPPDLGVFDLVLAADVMYEQRNAIALADLVPHILAPGGRMLLGDPGRRYLPEFQSRMRQRHFIEREMALIDEPNDDPSKPSSRVQIIEFAQSGT